MTKTELKNSILNQFAKGKQAFDAEDFEQVSICALEVLSACADIEGIKSAEIRSTENKAEYCNAHASNCAETPNAKAETKAPADKTSETESFKARINGKVHVYEKGHNKIMGHYEDDRTIEGDVGIDLQEPSGYAETLMKAFFGQLLKK